MVSLSSPLDIIWRSCLLVICKNAAVKSTPQAYKKKQRVIHQSIDCQFSQPNLGCIVTPYYTSSSITDHPLLITNAFHFHHIVTEYLKLLQIFIHTITMGYLISELRFQVWQLPPT